MRIFPIRPCVTDNSGITTYRLTALGSEIEHPAYTPVGVWSQHTYLYRYVCCGMVQFTFTIAAISVGVWQLLSRSRSRHEFDAAADWEGFTWNSVTPELPLLRVSRDRNDTDSNSTCVTRVIGVRAQVSDAISVPV